MPRQAQRCKVLVQGDDLRRLKLQVTAWAASTKKWCISVDTVWPWLYTRKAAMLRVLTRITSTIPALSDHVQTVSTSGTKTRMVSLDAMTALLSAPEVRHQQLLALLTHARSQQQSNSNIPPVFRQPVPPASTTNKRKIPAAFETPPVSPQRPKWGVPIHQTSDIKAATEHAAFIDTVYKHFCSVVAATPQDKSIFDIDKWSAPPAKTPHVHQMDKDLFDFRCDLFARYCKYVKPSAASKLEVARQLFYPDTFTTDEKPELRAQAQANNIVHLELNTSHYLKWRNLGLSAEDDESLAIKMFKPVQTASTARIGDISILSVCRELGVAYSAERAPRVGKAIQVRYKARHKRDPPKRKVLHPAGLRINENHYRLADKDILIACIKQHM